jgi:hypothetical protein
MMGLSLLLALGVVASPAPAPPPNPQCVVWFGSEVRAEHAVHVRAEATMEARAEDVLAALEDFDHYPEYMPRVRRTERRPGGLLFTEIASPWPLKDVWFVAEVHRERLRPGGYLLRWTMRSGNLRQNSGAWWLAPLPGGRTRLRYEGDVELHHVIPPALLRMVEQLELPKVVQAVRLRALRGAPAQCPRTIVQDF